jgi:hypothetical protein
VCRLKNRETSKTNRVEVTERRLKDRGTSDDNTFISYWLPAERERHLAKLIGSYVTGYRLKEGETSESNKFYVTGCRLKDREI